MSAQGSSSSEAAVRVEAYLDDGSQAVQVLTAPPFRFHLDTATLEEGEHRLRLVRIDASGNRSERVIPFTVEHGPGLEVRGLEPGATVSGDVDVDVLTPAPPQPAPTTVQGPSTWLYLLATIVILGGIWVFFMVVPIYSSLVPEQTASGSSGSSSQASAPVDQTLLKAGETLYSSDCAACHKPSGEGMPPTFPALAGNSFLSSASAVVKRVYDGAGSMPSHHSYSAKQLAEVATYVRNTWGNSYGGVSVAEASKAVPQASGGSSSAGSTSSGSSSSSSGSSSSGSGASSSGASGTSSSSSGSTSSSGGSSSSSSTSASSGSASGSSASSSTSEAMAAGKKLYTNDCQGCHQPDGSGMPPTFPKLAGNDYLSNASNVVQRIYDGKGTMPNHHAYSAKQLADVATYIRNSFGNDYGPVSVAEAKQAAPKAAQ